MRWLGRGRRSQVWPAEAGHGGDWATDQLERRGIADPRVLAAMRGVPRERFVPRHLVGSAYDDSALSIGRGQTISQPYIVASMTNALALSAWSTAHAGRTPKVLDVGTGSGYQAAVLAEMGAEVVSIELDPELAKRAAKLLASLQYKVKVLVGDGSQGVPDEAPFDAIVVAAAAPDVPQPLVDQLVDGGRLAIPVGSRQEQTITVVCRNGAGIETKSIEAAVFVPLLGEHGFGSR